MTRISETQLDLQREPLVRPFGFKGAAFTEKWIANVQLTSQDGCTGQAAAGFAVLWSDEQVFANHTEVGGNVLMAALLERGLHLARQQPMADPLDLLDRIFPAVHDYGRQVTQQPALRPTFSLNALVALDHAAWMLTAAQRKVDQLDDLLPASLQPALSYRHDALACVPLLSYHVEMDEVVKLVEQGHFILKIKLGAAGSPAEMLQQDLARIEQIHTAVGQAKTPHTQDGRIRYYLDANGRYPDVELVARLVDGLDRFKAREQVLLLEEPLPEHVEQPVADLGVRVAADESLHQVADVRQRAELGYDALALKPAGKTLSMTLQMLAEAHRLGLGCFVADSACTPRMMDWNRVIASRIAPLAGLRTGCLESNGPQHYRRWDALLQSHPAAGAGWLVPDDGLFHLDASFHATTGSLLAQRPTGAAE